MAKGSPLDQVQMESQLEGWKAIYLLQGVGCSSGIHQQAATLENTVCVSLKDSVGNGRTGSQVVGVNSQFHWSVRALMMYRGRCLTSS